jgi:hypothetical protein
MAKVSTGRAAPAKAKAPPPPAAVQKKAKAAVATPKKKTAAKPALKKTAAPKMVPAPQKAAAKKAAPKKGIAKGVTPKKAVAKAKTAAPKKAAAAPAKKTAPPKVTARAKTVAVKKAAARRPVARVAVPTPAARRGRPVAAPRKVTPPAPARKLGAAPQVFTVSHLNEADFKADGLRAYAQYRDLGIAAATGGLCQAHVIRMIPPCTDEVRKRHVHQTDLQLVYVLKGWMKNEFEGHGEQMMSAGSCWLQPSGIKHTVLDYSADCEVLEIIVPADFKTEELV